MNNEKTEYTECVHAAAGPSCCQRMAKKYKLELVEIRPNGVKDLPVDCVFKGKQKKLGEEG